LLLVVGLLLAVPRAAPADDREDSKKYYDEGKAKVDGGEVEAAIPLLEKSLELDSRNFKAQKLLAEALDTKGKLLISEGSLDKALEVYTRAYKLWPNNSEIKATYEGLKAGTIQAKPSGTAPTGETKPIAAAAEAPKTAEEVKSQIARAEQTLIEIAKAEAPSGPAAQTDEKAKALQEELDRQKQLIAKMKIEYESTAAKKPDTTAIKNDSQKVEDLLFLYQQMLAQKTSEEKTSDLTQFVEVMKQYRTDLEKQSVSPLSVAIIAGGSSLALIVVVLTALLLFVRSRGRRRAAQRAQAGVGGPPGYYPGGLYQQQPAYGPEEERRSGLLLGYDGGDQGAPEIAEPAEEVSDDMYRDLLKYDKLKKIHTQMKTGNLNWDTVRENIDILHKDLQTEILKIVEMKMNAGDVTDYSTILPVLFPFLTSGDDYLRKKSNVLAYKLVETEKQGAEKAKETGEDKSSAELKDLSDVRTLTRYAADLDKLLGLKTHSLNVANYARRIGVTIGLDKEQIDLLYKAGLVHDFGYFLYDDSVFGEIKKEPKLGQKLTAELALHPEKGVEYFTSKNITLPTEIEGAIRCHHERNDGSGYPNGIASEEIPMFAKIIAVADVLEALLSDRPYREKMNFNSATIVMRDLGRNKLELTYINALIDFFKKI